MKNEKGITLLALILTVLLMIILAGAAIRYGAVSSKEAELQKFSYELQQIQGRVDSIHEKMTMDKNTKYISLDGEDMGQPIGSSTEAAKTLKKVKGLDYYASGSGSNPDLYYEGNGVDAYYRYFSKSDLDRILDVRNAEQDVIINFKTREVISVKGKETEDKTYYSLKDLSKGSGTSSGSETPPIVNPSPEKSYVTSGLILHYDGINNTPSGHSNTATTWKDLSGRGNDGDLLGFDSTSGWESNCLKFDGMNDYVLSKNNLGISGNTELTMCAVASWEGNSWMSQWPSYMGINYTNDYQGLSMTMYEGKPALDFWNYRYIATNALAVKRKYQICLTKKVGSIDSTSKIYINGVEVAGIGNSTNSHDIVNAQAVVGRLDDTRWANAKIYNVKYYNRALTEQEIQKNYRLDKERFGL